MDFENGYLVAAEQSCGRNGLEDTTSTNRSSQSKLGPTLKRDAILFFNETAPLTPHLAE
jgi:hypothetical protein